MNTHQCPYPSCTHQIESKHFACSVHWMQLPEELRDAINHASRRRDMVALRAGHREAMLWMYRAAQQAPSVGAVSGGESK